MYQNRLFSIFRSLLSILVVSLALTTVTLMIPSPTYAAGSEPSWGMPFRNYTSISIGSLRLHYDNFSTILDDRTSLRYTLNTPSNLSSPPSLDLVLEPEIAAKNAVSPIPTLALANGTVLAVQKACHNVLINYGNGWWAIYIHQANIQVTFGQHVNTNTIIGYPVNFNGKNSMCGTESSSDLHIHFAFLKQDTTKTRYGNYVPMAGRTLSGHLVTSTGHLNGLADPYFVVPNIQSPDIFGQNLWITGHDADLHCSLANPKDPTTNFLNQCHYLQVAINFVTRGPYRGKSVLVLDHGTLMRTAINNAFGTGAAPQLTIIDPRTQFSSLPLLDTKGHPLYSAIVVASDITCGGCDNNDAYLITPDSDAINARASDIKNFFYAGGGIMALAGSENLDVFYSFLPLPVTATSVTTPFSLTPVGNSLGLLGGSGKNTDDNCCQTHNSFESPPILSSYQVAESDGAGLPETLIAQDGFATLSTNQSHPVQLQQPHVPHN